MPVEIREIIIRAELSPRLLSQSTSEPSQSLTPETISTIKSICIEEFQQIRKKFSHCNTNKKFER